MLVFGVSHDSELEEALLVLAFSYVLDLLRVLHAFIRAGWHVELSCRCLFFLLRYGIYSLLCFNF